MGTTSEYARRARSLDPQKKSGESECLISKNFRISDEFHTFFQVDLLESGIESCVYREFGIIVTCESLQVGILPIPGLGALLLIPFLVDLGVQKFPEFFRGFLRMTDGALGAQRADFVELNAAKAPWTLAVRCCWRLCVTRCERRESCTTDGSVHSSNPSNLFLREMEKQGAVFGAFLADFSASICLILSSANAKLRIERCLRYALISCVVTATSDGKSRLICCGLRAADR